MRAWTYQEVTAVHEAGHAIVAVHLKVKVNYLAISTCDEGFLRRGINGFVHTKESRRQAEHSIIVCAAGDQAERYFSNESSGGNAGDELLIEELAERAKIPKMRIGLLRRRTARLMRTWYIQVAIVNLTRELLERDKIPGARAKYIYRKAKSLRSRTVPVAGLKSPEDWMFDWTPKTFDKDLDKLYE